MDWIPGSDWGGAAERRGLKFVTPKRSATALTHAKSCPAQKSAGLVPSEVRLSDFLFQRLPSVSRRKIRYENLSFRKNLSTSLEGSRFCFWDSARPMPW